MESEKQPENINQLAGNGYKAINPDRIMEQAKIIAVETLMAKATAEKFANNPELLPLNLQQQIVQFKTRLKEKPKKPRRKYRRKSPINWQKWRKLAAIALLSGAIVISGVSILSGGCVLALLVLLTDGVEFPASKIQQPISNSQHLKSNSPQPTSNIQNPTPLTQPPTPTNPRFYRTAEQRRIVAALLAKSSILCVGAEGSGKTFLATSVVEELRSQGFTVVLVEPASPKQQLLEICDQLQIEPTSLEGKALTIDQLRSHISSHLLTTTAILVLDDAHLVEQKQRLWFKALVKQRQPMAVFATLPPKTDLFLSLSPLSLARLPEFAIREIMIESCIEFGISLSTSELAGLQQRAGGNPALARRAVESIYLGVGSDEEASDSPGTYYDAAPLVLILGACLMVARYVSLGTNNPQLYILAGVGSSIFIFLSKIMFRIPPDSRRIE